MGIYKVSIETGFSAAHRLDKYMGKCENLHGHNWKVRVTVASETVDETGLAMDFKELKAVAKEIMSRFDHVNLSDLPEFRDENPTTENIARIVYKEIERRLEGRSAKIHEVAVGENETSWASYAE